MYTKGEFVYVGTFTAKVENTNLGVGDTTVEPRLWVWLYPNTQS